jgi:polyprenyl-phospho-N-acetylgalactosaminyl synthase
MKTKMKNKLQNKDVFFDKNHVYIVIAAYNEGNRIAKVISSLLNAGYKNIVVTDDGSKDNTFDIISQFPIYYLRHMVNRGQGASLKTGIDFALKKGAKFIVTFDADGQHRIQDLPAMIAPVAKREYDVTLGSRFLQKTTKMPASRWLTLKIGIMIQWLFYGLLLSDAHNGFRCFSMMAAKKVEIHSNRMEHASEIVEEIKRNRLRYLEVPVTIDYNEDTLRKGHGGFLQGTKVFWKMIWHKLR